LNTPTIDHRVNVGLVVRAPFVRHLEVDDFVFPADEHAGDFLRETHGIGPGERPADDRHLDRIPCA
jgi:hypothetical protein